MRKGLWGRKWLRVDRGIRFEHATCGRGNFLNPESKSCEFKNIRIRVDGAKITQLARSREFKYNYAILKFPQNYIDIHCMFTNKSFDI